MKLRFQSPSHVIAQPNYRVRWYRVSAPTTVVHSEFTQFGHNRVMPVGTTTPQVYEWSLTSKPPAPHTESYVVTVACEAATGNSPESAPSAPFSLAPPEAPSAVIVIDPAL